MNKTENRILAYQLSLETLKEMTAYLKTASDIGKRIEVSESFDIEKVAKRIERYIENGSFEDN
jgi:hypothetical protein